MQKLLIMLCLIASLSTGAWAISIYDIQFTTNPGSDGTYPSKYVGKSVSLEGIVTATNYRNGGYFISEALNGAWRGILILDRNARVKQGDRIYVSGSVTETYGMTCIQDIIQTRVLESSSFIPRPIILTTGQLSSAAEAEAYEGVYVKLMNATAFGTKALKNKVNVTDGSGTCVVQSGVFGDRETVNTANGTYSSISGIVLYSYSEFTLSPISANDVVKNQPTSVQSRSWGKIKSIYK
ncbi:hypothetical protein MASR2M64_00240 [Candidatus Cloacimonadota bacterium]